MPNPLPGAAKITSVAEDTSIAARAANATKYTFKKGVSALGHFGGAWVGISTAATALISQWEHTEEKKRITNEYREEIGTMLGKRPDKVTVSDMEKAAKENDTIKEALDRSTKHRNLSVGVTIAGAAIAIGIIAPLAAMAVGAALPALAGLGFHAAVGAVTALGFLGTEKGLEKFGEKKLHLEEPALKKVFKREERQSELSVPSQITFLAHKQAHRQAVSQEQVMTVFTTANAGLDRQIQASYGKKFTQLGDEQKRQAIETSGAQYNVAALTADINDHHVRAQELGFIVHGQSSGVAPIGSSHIVEIGNKAAALSAPLEAEAPVTTREAAGERIAFARSQVSGTPARQQQAPEESAWRRRIEAERQQQAAMGLA